MAHEVEKWIIIKELTATDDHRVPKRTMVLRKGKSYNTTVYVSGPIPPHVEISKDRMEDLRKIIDIKKAQDVEGQEVSPFMASILCSVYDHLSDDGKRKFDGLPLQRLMSAGDK